MPDPASPPDPSQRTLRLSTARHMAASAPALYDAFTLGFERWFAAPGTLLSRGELNTAFYFATQHEGQKHPHYGRFLKLIADRLVELTWVTAAGTHGVETVVTVELRPETNGTHLTLTHAGFADPASRDRHEQAWPVVLAHLDATVR